MRIVIVAVGTRGDVQPMLALALELRRRGHEVVFVAPPSFGGWIAAHGLTFHGVGRDPQAFLAEAGLNINKALRMLRQDAVAEFDQLGLIIPGADLVVGASATCAGLSHGERLGIPYVYVVFSPSLIPSRHHPAPTCKLLRLPRWMNRVTWWAHHRLWNALFRRIIDEQRARLRLPPIADVWSHIQSSDPLVVACEPALAPVEADAPARVRQPGALFLDESGVDGGARASLPPDLERFLHAGPAPVYVGFGSMVDGKPASSTSVVLKALRRARVRAVIARGWAGLGDGAAGEDVFVAGNVPHTALFPRLAAVVHHGGAGTTTAAARAGLPQLLVPHVLDQFFWADRIARLGLGPPAITRGRLTAGRLAAGLGACMDDERYRSAARALAGRIITDGVARMAALIEERGDRRIAAVNDLETLNGVRHHTAS